MTEHEAPNLPKAPDTQQAENLIGELEERLSQLKSWQQESDQHFAQLQEHTRRLDEQRAEIEQQRQEIAAQRHHVDQQREAFDEQQAQLQARQQQLSEQEDRLNAERQDFNQQQAELEQQRRQLDEARGGIEDDQAELADRHQQLDAQRSELDAQQQQRTDAIEAQQQQREQLEQLSDELEQRTAELEAREAELEQKLDAQRHQIEQAQQQADRDLQQRSSEFEQRAAEFDRRTADFDQQQSELDHLQSDLKEREAEHEQKLSDYQQTLKQSKDKLVAERDQFEQKQRELDKRAEQVEVTHKKSKTRNQREATRRAKLHQYRKLMRKRTEGLRQAEVQLQVTRQQYTGLEQQRQMLVEVKKFLESSEAEMVRRWATHKSATLVVGMVLCVLLLTVVSYGSANRFVHPVWRATAVFEATPPEGAETSTAAWLNHHQQLILGDVVMGETISQLNLRGNYSFKDAQSLREHLRKTLMFTAATPGRLELTYRHSDKAAAPMLLESIGRAFVGYQTTLDRIADRAISTRILQAAAVDPKPVEDRRLMVAGILFVSLLLTTSGLTIVARWWLRRASRVFDAEANASLAVLDDPDAWADAAAESAEPAHEPND